MEIPLKKFIDLEQLRPVGEANRVHAARPLPEYETFTMKKSYPKLVDYFYKSGIHLDRSYDNIRRLVLKYCAMNRIIISRIQLETVELNLPGHVSELFVEAVPLVTASNASLTSEPQAPEGMSVCASLPSTPPAITVPSFSPDMFAPDAIEFPLSVLSSHGFRSPSYSPLSSDGEES